MLIFCCLFCQLFLCFFPPVPYLEELCRRRNYMSHNEAEDVYVLCVKLLCLLFGEFFPGHTIIDISLVPHVRYNNRRVEDSA